MDKKWSIVFFFVIFGGLVGISMLEERAPVRIMSGVAIGLLITGIIILAFLVQRGEVF